MLGVLHVGCMLFVPATGSAQTVRDSAGIRIVVSARPSWTPVQQLHLAPTPSLTIGDRDGEAYLLSGVKGAMRLSDGRIVLANGGSNELRFFDASGVHIKSVGGKGDGPGDFRRIRSATRLVGDTIAVLHENTVLSLFTSSGAFIKRTRELAPLNEMRASGTTKGAMLALNGGVRVIISVPIRPTTGSVGTRSAARALHVLADMRDSVLRDLGQYPFMEMISETTGPGKPWLGAEEVFFSTGSKFYVGYGNEYAIRRYSAKGDLEQIVRRAWTPAAITPKDISTFVEEWLVLWSKKPGALDSDRKDLLDDNYATTLPAFSALIADQTGRLWVRAPKAIDGAVAGSLNDHSIGQSTWSVFGTDGRWLGDVTMPARFAPTEIAADYVLGIARDDDGVQTVVRYTLGTK